VRLNPLLRLLLLAACLPAALHAAVLVTLSSSSLTLNPKQTATLQALVVGATNPAVTWSFSPRVGILDPVGNPPSSGGL
jgi:hypothetical protein